MKDPQVPLRLPTVCPACDAQLYVQTLTCSRWTLTCSRCSTRIEGQFPLSVFLLLPAAEQQFILEFVLCSGSLKEMAARQGLSYPTVRNRLDEIIEHLNTLQHEKPQENR